MAIDIPKMTTALVPIGNSYDDIIVEGDSFERSFEYQEDDGTAIDFTDYTGAAQVRDDSDTLIATLTVSALDATGIFSLSLATLPAVGTYMYDVEIVGGAIRHTLQRGAFQTSRNITQ